MYKINKESIDYMSIFTCPVCGKPLASDEKRLVCPSAHSFDRASSGYVNLLTADKMNSKLPGDNKLMVRARQSFLERGHYGRLLDTLAAEAVKRTDVGVILDAGCGDGYYTCGVDKALTEAGIPHITAGIDISKTAVNAAAKRSARMGLNADFAVASVFSIPAADSSCAVLMTIFAPFCADEFLRVLRRGGHMLMVIPAERHLFGLKSAVYKTPYLNEVRDYALDGFDFTEKTALSYTIKLENAEEIQSLFMMTPYFYKTGREDQARLEALERLETEVAFELLVYTKK